MIELKFCISQAKLHNETKYFTKDFTSYCIISELRGVLKSISERIRYTHTSKLQKYILEKMWQKYFIILETNSPQKCGENSAHKI